ncbi:hypothetical protein J8F10_22425 [Gemmata sp. G18]|uniref:Uncharacterized protein n=1 Tax=Gemmata palustris TaxID=2822762 RepID=A0ABS5BWA7_9BACT|nr:hypothetical protein [Gemmata palustris]MBP3958021.1 hypothetical protein [Gemmata palustris]
MPDYVKYGIHVMASQNDRGEVVIGDSHEYDADISLFDKVEIDDLILKQLRAMADLPDWTISARWHGIYAKHPEKHFVTAEPQPGCVIGVARRAGYDHVVRDRRRLVERERVKPTLMELAAQRRRAPALYQ